MSIELSTIELYQQMNTEAAAVFLDVTPRKLEQFRQHGNGPKFIRVSKKCVKYRLKDLIEFQEERLAINTVNPAT